MSDFLRELSLVYCGVGVALTSYWLCGVHPDGWAAAFFWGLGVVVLACAICCRVSETRK